MLSSVSILAIAVAVATMTMIVPVVTAEELRDASSFFRFSSL